jgi:hypothetical protein
LLDLKIGESRRTDSKEGHGWKEDTKGVAPVELKDESKPIFRIVGNHRADSIG